MKTRKLHKQTQYFTRKLDTHNKPKITVIFMIFKNNYRLKFILSLYMP